MYQTPNIDVFFDNLQVTHNKGRLLEENHYYPFGLVMANLSSKAIAGLDNKFKFQSQEYLDELNINWGSFKWRNYDYTLGRFLTIDPLSDKFITQAPYNFSENQVTAYRELEGLEKIHFQYVFTKTQITVNKVEISGPLGNGVLVSSNHNGKLSFYYGKTVSSTLAAFKKSYEGVNLDDNKNHLAYLDSKGNPTIGYGHKIIEGDNYSLGSKITEKEALDLFENDSKTIIQNVDKYIENFDLNQSQKNALYDAAFNMGPGKVKQYTEDGSMFSKGKFFLQFMAGGEGLKKRRYAESILFNEGISVKLDLLKGNSLEQILNYLNTINKHDKKKK